MDDRITMEGMSEQGSRADFLNDTGLSKAEMTELVAGYQATMKRLNAAVHAEGGFTWMLIKGRGPQVRPMPDRHMPVWAMPERRALNWPVRHECVCKLPDETLSTACATRRLHAYAGTMRLHTPALEKVRHMAQFRL